MKKHFSILFTYFKAYGFCLSFFLIPALAYEQCNFKQLIQESKIAADNSNFTFAIQKLISARRCDPNQSAKIDTLIETLVRRMEQERIISDSLLEIAKNEQEKKEEVLNQLYFFANRFGLAGDENGYFFIDKKGNRRIVRTYEEALPFDITGFARVRMAGRYFLLDSTGVEYPLATELSDLTATTEALDLRNHNLDTFPTTILEYPNLKILLLSDNLLKSIPVEIGSLSQLKSLHLANNFLTFLPATIGDLTQLLDLNVAKNELRSIPNAIGELSNLQKLVLDRNLIALLPATLGNLQSLRSLFISKNKLSLLPSELGKLNKLINLDLGENKLSALPKSLGNLLNLKYLRLQENNLSSLPKEIGQLGELQILLLNNNQLTGLPSEVGQLAKLRYLFLFRNRLEKLPVELSKLAALNSVLLTGNTNLKFNEICRAFANFPKPFTLTSSGYQSKYSNQLAIRVNDYSEIPPEIGLLTNLETLELPENNLKNLPVEIGQLHKLKSLDLTRNDLKRLPEEISGLSNLRNLSLANNQLDSLPTVFFRLNKLETLYLGNNNFSVLPADFGKLTRLKDLVIFNNHLKTLPNELGLLGKLQFLLLQNNELEQLPRSMDHLQSLRSLVLFGNGNLPLDQICQTFCQHPRPIVLATEGAKGTKDPRCLLIEIDRQDSLLAELVQMPNLQQIQLFTDTLKAIAEPVFQLTKEQLDFADAAYSLYINGNYPLAYHAALVNAQKRPQDFSAWVQVCDYGLLAKVYPKAIEAAQKVLNLNPDYAEVYSKLALAYTLNGEYQKALPIIKEWKDVPLTEGTYQQVFLADLSRLEATGIKHSDFAKLREALGK